MGIEEKLTAEGCANVSSCSLFRGLGKKETDKALELFDFTVSAYKKNDILLNTGDAFSRFGLVASGRIKVMVDDIEGNSAIMAEVKPGHTFGESMCILGNASSGVYIVAAEDSAVVWLSTDRLFRGSEDENILLLEKRFTEMLARRTLQMNNRIQILSKKTLREKIIAFLTFAHKAADGKTVEISMSREEMAIYFGTDRSALSRELSNMKKEGLIDYNKNIFTIKF